MKHRVIAALAVAGLVTAGLGMTAGAAGAATSAFPDGVSATAIYTGPANPGGVGGATLSMAGYYTNNFGDLFTQVNGTFSLNAEAEGVGISCVNGESTTSTSTACGYAGAVPYTATATVVNGAIGIQLCNETTGSAAQLGAVYLGTGEFAVGYVTGTLEGLVADPCVGGGVLSGSTTFTSLAEVPVGNSIQGRIRQDGHGVLFTAALVGGIANYTYYKSTGWIYPNEAGAGLQADTTGLSAPAVNDLTDFSGVTATDGGTTNGFAAWNAFQVDGSQDGMAPALLSPNSSLTPLTGGSKTCVWHKGYWVHHYNKHHHPKHWRTWHKGYNVCTVIPGGASSFSIYAGTPVS